MKRVTIVAEVVVLVLAVAWSVGVFWPIPEPARGQPTPSTTMKWADGGLSLPLRIDFGPGAADYAAVSVGQDGQVIRVFDCNIRVEMPTHCRQTESTTVTRPDGGTTTVYGPIRKLGDGGVVLFR